MAVKTKKTKVATKSYRDYIKDSLINNPTFSNYDHGLMAWNSIRSDGAEDSVIPSIIGAVVPMVRNSVTQPIVAAVFEERKDIDTQQRAAKGKKGKKGGGTVVEQRNPWAYLSHVEFPWIDDEGNAHRANYLDATPEQHEARIKFLQKDVNGIEKTISGHQQAIDDMNAEGVKSLRAVLKKRPEYEVPDIT